jgi:asparagine synthetase B (glutamine-hydrolysing)
MYGIIGLLDVTHSDTAEKLRNIALRMADSLRLRGPNDFGVRSSHSELCIEATVNMRICQRQGKWILRGTLQRYVPRDLVDRPKSDFRVPPATWLHGSLRGLAESLLWETRRQYEYFRPASLLKMWREHFSRKINSKHRLSNILMFQAWLGEGRKTGYQAVGVKSAADVATRNA